MLHFNVFPFILCSTHCTQCTTPIFSQEYKKNYDTIWFKWPFCIGISHATSVKIEGKRQNLCLVSESLDGPMIFEQGVCMCVRARVWRMHAWRAISGGVRMESQPHQPWGNTHTQPVSDGRSIQSGNATFSQIDMTADCQYHSVRPLFLTQKRQLSCSLLFPLSKDEGRP